MDYDIASLILFRNNSLEIRKAVEKDFNYLMITFYGKFSEPEAIGACRVCQDIYNASPVTHFTLIWNFENMNGFEWSAKSKWLECMKGLSNQTNEIWTVPSNILMTVWMMFYSLLNKQKVRTFKNVKSVNNGLLEAQRFEIVG